LTNDGTSMWAGDLVKGVLSLIYVLFEETTHTCAKLDEFRIGGAP
jgi:hypothetical protein